jgi:hypothetical protein
LLWPVTLFALAWLARRRPARVVAAVFVVGVLSFVASVHLTATNEPWAFFSLPTRIWELTAGGLLAILEPQLRRIPHSFAAVAGIAGLVAVVVAMVHFGASTPFPGDAALLPVAGAAAVVAAGCRAQRHTASLVLDRAPMQRLGRYSYAWYLWHWPVLVLAAAAIGHGLSRADSVALIIASLVLAALTTELVERPIRFSRVLSLRPQRSLALGAVLTAAALTTAVATADAVPALRGHGEAVALSPRLGTTVVNVSKRSRAAAPHVDVTQPIRAALASTAVASPVPANLQPNLTNAAGDKAAPFVDGCDNTYTDAQVHECAYADTASKTTIVLFGDSHAAQYFPALDLVARLQHWRLVVLTKATCPPFDLSIFSPVLGRTFRECDQWREAAFARIAAERPAVVVMGVARHYDASYHFSVYGAQWLAGIRESVARVRATGAAVLVIGPTPKPPFDVPGCLSANLGNAAACATPRGLAVNEEGLAGERAAAVAAGAQYLDVAPWICTPRACPAVVDDLLVYRDDNHLTTTYVTWLTPAFAAVIDSMVMKP